MSRPAARPRTGAQYSGACPPSTTTPPHHPLFLSFQTKYPPTQRGTPSAHPARASRAEVSSPPEGKIQTQRHQGHGPACHIGARVPHLRERPHRSDAQRQGGIAASQPRIIHIPAPHHIPFRAPRRHRNHARVAQPPPITPSTSRAITGPTRSSITGSPALPIATQASHAVADAPTNPLFPPRVRHFAASPGSRAK